MVEVGEAVTPFAGWDGRIAVTSLRNVPPENRTSVLPASARMDPGLSMKSAAAVFASTASMGVAVAAQKAMPRAKRHQLAWQVTSMEACFKTTDVKLAETNTHADQ